MSREYQERIKPISKDGEASITAQMRICYRKAKVAEALGDTLSAENNLREFLRLKTRLAKRIAREKK